MSEIMTDKQREILKTQQEKTKTNLETKCVIVTIHGIRKNNTMKGLRALIAEDILFKDSVIEPLDYGFVRAIANYMPILRHITARLVVSFLRRIYWQYPNAEIKVIAHSNGTWAVGRALEKRKLANHFKINKLLLFGCVLKRKFNWNRFEEIKVINFYAKNDFVVLLAKPFYAMGWSGRYGFKQTAPNLAQIANNTGHTGFLAEYKTIRSVLK